MDLAAMDLAAMDLVATDLAAMDLVAMDLGAMVEMAVVLDPWYNPPLWAWGSNRSRFVPTGTCSHHCNMCSPCNQYPTTDKSRHLQHCNAAGSQRGS